MDGESAVDEYRVELHKSMHSGDNPSVIDDPVTNTWVTYPTEPFSRYHIHMYALGPREVAGLTESWHSAEKTASYMVTRPSFSAMTVSVSQKNSAKPFYFTASSLGVTPPTFEMTGEPSYLWEYKVAPDGAWTSFPSGNPSANETVAFPDKVTGASEHLQDSLSFRCTATVTIGGVPTVVKSPIMTRNNPRDGDTLTMANFTPDFGTSW
jgi:hypothetical protein